MNSILTSLADVCRRHPLAEKIFIVPSHRIGHQLSESLVPNGTNYVNLRVATLFDLALDSVSLQLAAENISLLSGESALSAIEEIFESDIHNKNGLYFCELEPGVGIVSALHRALQDLRLAGVQVGDLRPAQFVSPEKHKGVVTMMEKFEARLSKNGQADESAIYRMAINAVPQKSNTESIWIVYPRLSLSFLPHKFLRALTNDRFVVLDIEPLVGLEPPKQFPLWKNDGAASESPFSWIGSPRLSPKVLKNGPVDLFHAVGSTNEVKEVLRRVLYGGLPLDSVEIACIDYQKYSSLFYLEQQKRNLGVTFGEGIPSSFTAPGEALLGFVDWIESDYSVTELRHLVSADVLSRKSIRDTPAVGSQEIIRILRSANIGWGRDRYVSLLSALVKDAEEKARAPGEEDDADRGQEWNAERAGRTTWLLEFMKSLFACTPDLNNKGETDTREFADRLNKFLIEFCSRADDLSRAAYSALAEMLQEVVLSANGPKPVGALCDRVRLRIQELRVGASSPRPGHIHVTSYQKAGACCRANNFVVGLEEQAFPGALMEDPVLLDGERRKISGDLILSTDRFEERLLSLYAYFAGVRGSLTLSFTSYSVEEGREVAPSPVILRVLRLISGKPEADYSEVRSVLGDPVSFSSGRPIDNSEWWLGRLLPQAGSAKARKKVLGSFPHLAQGLAAEEARGSEDFTEYDGGVQIDPARDDPRKSKEMVLSASRIESLAGCPFGYFVRYVLGLEPPDDIEFDPSVWLDPASRGSLLHSVYEEFMSALLSRGEKAQTKKHQRLLLDIAGRLVEEMRKEIPPPSDRVFDAERQEILASLEIFLRMEEGLSANVTPRFFEMQFGIRGLEKDAPGKIDPVKIEIGKSSFLLRGRIDRVDETGKHEYRVVDYKTGGAFGFSSKAYFEHGTNVQHCLYARAAEAILREKTDKTARVVEGAYYFPTRKGRAQFLHRAQNRATDVNSLLNTLFDIIKNGAFAPSKEECFLCRDYALCESTQASLKEKMANVRNTALEPIRKLEEYD
jgi:ATP-dependent helicase/nuclease subunit B